MSDVGLVVLGGFLAVVGGALGGALGSVVLGRIETARENVRQSHQHRAAVRAVVFELAADYQVAKLGMPGAVGQFSTVAHDSLLLAFYEQLPPDVAMKVSLAYQLMHAVGDSPRNFSRYLAFFEEAIRVLREYAEELGLTFPAQTLGPGENDSTDNS